MLLAFLVACGGPEVVPEPPRQVAPREEEPVSQVGQGGTARLLLPVEPGCLNPYLAACRGAEALTGTVLEAPLAVGQSSGYLPVLAEAIPSYEAGTLSLEPFTVEIRLRRGAAFSDGEPLTSRDVEWTYEGAARLSERGGLAPLYSGFDRLERVETPDARTARLVFREPYAAWRELLTAPILPEHAYRGRDISELSLNEKMLGSGPFVLEGRKEGAISFRQNEDYWIGGPPLPNLEALEVSFPGPRKAAESLERGAADFGFFSVGGAVPGSGDLLRAEAARTRVELLLFNPERLDEDERGAIAGVLSRERIAATVNAPVASGLTPDGSAWEDTGERSGTRPPSTLELVYPTGDPARERVAEALAAGLRPAGEKVEARAVSPGRFFGKILPNGDFDAALFDVGTLPEYGALIPALPPRSGGKLTRALGAVEDDERARLLSGFQRDAAREEALVPLFVWPDAYAWSSGLSGPQPETPYRGIARDVREWGLFK